VMPAAQPATAVAAIPHQNVHRQCARRGHRTRIQNGARPLRARAGVLSQPYPTRATSSGPRLCCPPSGASAVRGTGSAVAVEVGVIALPSGFGDFECTLLGDRLISSAKLATSGLRGWRWSAVPRIRQSCDNVRV
jgi:hypothetical protein